MPNCSKLSCLYPDSPKCRQYAVGRLSPTEKNFLFQNFESFGGYFEHPLFQPTTFDLNMNFQSSRGAEELYKWIKFRKLVSQANKIFAARVFILNGYGVEVQKETLLLKTGVNLRNSLLKKTSLRILNYLRNNKLKSCNLLRTNWIYRVIRIRQMIGFLLDY